MMDRLAVVARRPAGFLVRISILTVSVVELGCQTDEVRSSADAKTDFSHFQTFNFAAPLPASGGHPQLTEKDRQRIQAAVVDEMARRDCRLAEQPELFFSIDLGSSVESYNRQNPTVGDQSMAANLGREYGLQYDRNLGDQATVQYNEGTLSFRVFETKGNRLIWKAQASGVLYGDRTDAEVQKRIQAAVQAVFAKFPIKPKK